MRRLSVIAVLLDRRALSAQVTFDRILNANKEPQNWLTYSGQADEPALQPARRRSRREREESRAAVGLPGAVARKVRSHAAGGGRHHVHRPGAERRGRARRRDGRIFWIYSYAPSPRAPLLRTRQSRPRHSRRHAVHGHHRRPPDRDRREERQAALEHHGGATPKPATPSRTRRWWSRTK